MTAWGGKCDESSDKSAFRACNAIALRAQGVIARRDEMTPTITHYTVSNRITGKTTEYKTSAAASRAMDRMDAAYGAYICTRKAHWSDEA